MNFDSAQLAADFEKAFGTPIESLTEAQLWWLVKVIKHCRGRCRSNAALNNYLNRNFKHARFETVPVTKENGDEFDSLRISIKTLTRLGREKS